MKARLKPVTAYELLGADGRVIARLVKVSSWGGMDRLQTDDGKTLIVEQPSGMEQTMAEAMSAIGAGDGTVECDIVKASPSLIASLQEQPGGAA